MEQKEKNPHRWLPVKLGLLSGAIFLAAWVVAPTDERAVGSYVSPSDSGLVVVKLRSGGTYVQYDQTQELTVGRWRLERRYVVFKTLVLEDSYRLPVGLEELGRGKGRNVYTMFHRAGELCFHVGPDPEYWCKQ